MADQRLPEDHVRVDFINADVSLLKNVDKAVEEIKRKTDTVDLLFLSCGYVTFGGRNRESRRRVHTMRVGGRALTALSL